MIFYILVTIAVIAILDTLFGNRLLPSEVSVLKFNNLYYVKKKHRILLIPVNLYLQYNHSQRDIFNFGNFNLAEEFSEDIAIKYAKVYSNKDIVGNDYTIAWSSKLKKREDEQFLELYHDLAKAVESKDIEEEKIILKQLYEYHNL